MAARFTNCRPISLPTHKLLGYKPDASTEDRTLEIAQNWLTRFELACTTHNPDEFTDLFASGGIWRDILAFTNDLRSISAIDIKQAASDRLKVVNARNAVFTETAPTLQHPFDDVSFIEVHFHFVTNLGSSFGLSKLVRSSEDNKWRAYTLFTLLEGIHGHPEHVGALRPRGTHNSKDSWEDQRKEDTEFEHADPDVLIVGAGHNGLEIAARLKALGSSSLLIDKEARLGDNWRLRYKSLSLHDPVWANHFAYLPFPSNWPVFTPSGKLANWFETYADVLELNVWCSSTLVPSETDFDYVTRKWNVTILRRDGSKRKFTVGHVVLATGLGGGYPKMPKPFEGQETFRGKIVHSSKHGSGAEWRGKQALVVGSCTSAHDISLDFFNNGTDVTMLQRSPTFIMTVENGMPMMMGNLYSEHGPLIDLADKIAESTPKFVVKLIHQRIIPKLAELDKGTLDGVHKAGFQTTSGEDGSGFIMMALNRGGGFYFDTGACAKVASGDIKIRNGEIASFDNDTVVFKDGSIAKPDIVVFATGYTGFPDTVRMTLGEKWVDQMSTVWSLDDEGELRGCYRESGIPNMYFMVGNLMAGRFYSKVTALQIKAQQLGIFGERYTLEKQRSSKK